MDLSGLHRLNVGDEQIVRLGRNLRAVVKHVARQLIENTVTRITGDTAIATSRDRNGRMTSRAHDRGAVDCVTGSTGTPAAMTEAKRVSL